MSDTIQSRLRTLNVGVGLAHLAQALLMLALTNDLAFPVTGTFLAGDPVAQPGLGTPEVLFDLPIGYAVAVFLLFAAADHLLMAVPPVRGWYEREIATGRNYARWIEYSLSASLMLVLIAALAGIWDVAALLGLFAANSAMILFGLLQERDHQPGGSMLPFWFGTVIGLVPWVAIGTYLVAGDDPPGFVYAIFVSLFVFFSSFGLNQWLQYRKVGRWREYVYGEKVYIWLSLGAKSALAWQIFANVLRS